MFVFDVSKLISFSDFHKFCDEEKIFFDSEKSKLFDKYKIMKSEKWDYDIKKYQNFRNEYRNLHQRILKDVISHYRNLLPAKCLITEFGSFVKHTERILSDIDFTICYDEPKTKEYECAEELIDYTLSRIFNFPIDHVHGNFQHYPKIPKFDSFTECDNLYRLQFATAYIDYKCGPETISENLTNIKNVRDYYTLITSFELKYKNNRDIDSLYSIEILENTTEHDFIGDLAKLEQKYDICKNYTFKTQKSLLDNSFTVSQMKHILKHDGIVELYIFMAKLRKYVQFGDSYSMTIEMLWNNKSLEKLFGKDYLYKLEKAFVSFIFYWNRIELSLNKRDIALSTRCYKSFTIEEMNELLTEDWGNSSNLQAIISAKNDLTSLVQEGLYKL